MQRAGLDPETVCITLERLTHQRTTAVSNKGSLKVCEVGFLITKSQVSLVLTRLQKAVR
jgi:hypothetical protein